MLFDFLCPLNTPNRHSRRLEFAGDLARSRCSGICRIAPVRGVVRVRRFSAYRPPGANVAIVETLEAITGYQKLLPGTSADAMGVCGPGY